MRTGGDNVKQFLRLCYFEWKKIVKRKSTWITLFIIMGTYILMEAFYLFGSTYIEGQFLETHMEGRAIDIENSQKLSGRKINDDLLKEMQQAYSKYAQNDDKLYMLTEDYQKNVRPYSTLYKTLNNMMYDRNETFNPLTVGESELYETVDMHFKAMCEAYGLEKSEQAYWQEKQEQLEKPFTYQYADGYDYMISMSGFYRISMLITFFISICISIVFTEEHSRKTDQLILCSMHGRVLDYLAKIVAGTLFVLLSTSILLILAFLLAFTLYGANGFSAAIQLIVGYYPEAFSVGQVCLLMIGILLLSSVLIGIFTMVLSELTHSNIASMATVIAIMFAARLIPIPAQYRVCSQAWNFLPINLLKFDEGFTDLRLVQLPGLQLTSWQFAIILYLILGILLMLIGKKVYCKYQVQGR